MTKEALLDEILRLAPEERLELLEAAWDVVSVDQESIPVPQWHRQVLAERPGSTGEEVPWDRVRERLRKRPEE